MKRLIMFVFVILSLINNIYGLAPDSDLISWWPDNTTDVIGVNNLTNNGATNVGGCIRGNCYSLDGVDDYLTSGVINGTDYKNETWNFWVKGDSTSADFDFLFSDIGQPDHFVRFQSDDKLMIRYLVGTTPTTSNAYRDDSWHLITVVMNTTQMHLYIDGNYTINSTIGAGGGETFSLSIGRSSAGLHYYKGFIDDMNVWNRSLSQADIRDYYNNGIVLEVPTITFANISVNNQTLVNNSYFNINSLNFTTILNTQNTNNNTNHSYYINGILQELGYFTINNLTGQLTLDGDIFDQKQQIEINNTRNGRFIAYNVTYPKEAARLQHCNDLMGAGSAASSETTYFGTANVSYWTGSSWLNVDNITNFAYLTKVLCAPPKNGYNYNITFFAWNNETNVTSSTFTFGIDQVQPNIQLLTNQTEFNTFAINFSNIFNVTDNFSGIDSCVINITELENVTVPDNFLINCTDTQVFNSSGLHNAYVIATDNAGNTNTTSWNFTIRPFIYIFFNDSLLGTQVLNYSAIIFHPDGRQTTPTENPDGSITLSPVNNGDLDLGVHTIQFTKFGFNIENFTVNVTESSNFNLTFNVSPVTLTMKMYDADNITKQLTFDVTILNSTTSILFSNQTNFSKRYDEIPVGNVELIVESSGYSPAYFYQTINPFTSISIIGYLINSNNTDVVTFQVTDKTTDESLSNVTVEAQQLINGTYITISQAQTGDSGEGFMFLDITRSYKFIFSKDGYVQATSQSIPGVTTYSVRLQPTGTEYNFIDGVSYSFTPDSLVLYDGLNYSLKGFISGTSITQITYTITSQNGTIIYNTTSTNPTGTTFTFNLTNLNASQYTQINQSMTYIKDGITRTVYRIYDTTTISSTSFIYYLKYEFSALTNEDNQILRWLVMFISIGGSFLLGRVVGAKLLGNSIIVILVAGFWAYVDWMPGLYFGAITTLTLLLNLGGGK